MDGDTLNGPSSGAPGGDDDCLTQIHPVCEAFEAAWRAGGRPRLETYLRGWTGPALRRLLVYLLELDIDYRRRAGESPQPADYTAALTRFDPHPDTLLQGIFAGFETQAADQPPVTVPASPPRAAQQLGPEQLGPEQLGPEQLGPERTAMVGPPGLPTAAMQAAVAEPV